MAVPKSVEKRIERIEQMLNEKRGKQVWVLRPGDQELEPHELEPEDIIIHLDFGRKIS